MDIEKPPPLRETATRFARAISLFANSEAGSKAKWMFAGLLALLCGANGLSLVNSYVGRNFMSAIAERQNCRIPPPADILCRRICCLHRRRGRRALPRGAPRTLVAGQPDSSRREALSGQWSLLPPSFGGRTREPRPADCRRRPDLYRLRGLLLPHGVQQHAYHHRVRRCDRLDQSAPICRDRAVHGRRLLP